MVPASCIGPRSLQGVAAEAVIKELNLHTAQESGKQAENLKDQLPHTHRLSQQTSTSWPDLQQCLGPKASNKSVVSCQGSTGSQATCGTVGMNECICIPPEPPRAIPFFRENSVDSTRLSFLTLQSGEI